MGDCCFIPSELFFSYIMVRTGYILLCTKPTHLVGFLYICSASSLEQRSLVRHVAPLRYICINYSDFQ